MIWIHLFYQQVISKSVIINDIAPSKNYIAVLLYAVMNDFENDFFLISQGTNLNKVIDQSIQTQKGGNPNGYVNSTTITCNELSAQYNDIEIGSSDISSVTVA